MNGHRQEDGRHRRPVLVTDGGNGQNRASLSAVRALGRAGHEVHVTVSQRPSVAGGSRFCARQILVPPVEHPEYRSAVETLVRQHGHVVVLPASDAALLALGCPGGSLVDKGEVARRSALAGFPVIPEEVYPDGHELRRRSGEIGYPVVVKPLARRGTADPAVWRADSPADLAPAEGLGPVVVQQYVSQPMRAVSGVMWDGQLRAVAHQQYLRTWPRDCGVACAAFTTTPDEALERRLPALLEGHDGIFQVQLLGQHVIDVNPRVYGSMALSTRAGLNLPEVLVRLAVGDDDAVRRPLRARPGTTYRWLEGDLKHLTEAVSAGDLAWRAAVRAAWPSRGTAHGDVSLSDPLPSVARLVYLNRSRRRRS